MRAPTRDRKSGLPLKSSRKIVSVVDDDIDISKLFQTALSENMEGITVVSFNDPILALEHFNENKSEYVLVISDLRMSGLNGLELLKRVKYSNSSVRTILMGNINISRSVVLILLVVQKMDLLRMIICTKL